MDFISLSSLRSTSLSSVTATEQYADEARCVLPIVSTNTATQTSIDLIKEKYVYRVFDSYGSGTFPTLDYSALSVVYDNADPCYFQFEIEWTTNSAIANYPSTYVFLNYPEIQTDGNYYTYYITVRIDVENDDVLMNCWRIKQSTLTEE